MRLRFPTGDARRVSTIATAVALLAVALIVIRPLSAAAEEDVAQPGDPAKSAVTDGHWASVESIARASGIADADAIAAIRHLAVAGGLASPNEATTARARPAPESSLLARKRVVSYYGNPWSAQMGILGELDPATLISRLKGVAAEYERAGGREVIPAIELIAVVAQAGPGADGTYRLRMPPEMIAEYSKLAADNGMLLILDVQVGHSTVGSEIEYVRPFLREPHVHLALDPEFDMWGAQKPGVELGHSTAAEVNYAQRVLAEIAASTGGQNKLLIVHQFRPSMLPDKSEIVDEPRVDLAVVMDGFGGRAAKAGGYRQFVGEDRPEFGGMKLFYRHDVELWSPAEVLALDPSPDVLIYQ